MGKYLTILISFLKINIEQNCSHSHKKWFWCEERSIADFHQEGRLSFVLSGMTSLTFIDPLPSLFVSQCIYMFYLMVLKILNILYIFIV